jgi:hypothetical protein
MISDMTDLPNSDVEQRGWKPAKARAACFFPSRPRRSSRSWHCLQPSMGPWR